MAPVSTTTMLALLLTLAACAPGVAGVKFAGSQLKTLGLAQRPPDAATFLRLFNEFQGAEFVLGSVQIQHRINFTDVDGNIVPYVCDMDISLVEQQEGISGLDAVFQAMFGSVREILGFLEISQVPCLTDYSFFSKLRIVHGEELRITTTNTGLIFRDGLLVEDFNSPTGTGTPLGLSSLTGVQAGDVFLDRTQLCVNSSGIATASGQVVVSQTSGCLTGQCDPSCNGNCWLDNDPNACQLHVCTSTCGRSGCQDDNLATCCPATCFGGCDANGKCHSCQPGLLRTNFPTGDCVAKTGSCDGSLVKFGFNLTQSTGNCAVFHYNFEESPFLCVDTCPPGFVIENGVCQHACTNGGDADANNVCIPNSGTHKVCPNIGVFGCKFQLDLLNATDCDMLSRSISIDKKSNLDDQPFAALQAMNKLTRIKGSLDLFQTSYRNFAFLENVVIIDGDDPAFSTTIRVTRNDALTALGLSGLREINGDVIEIRDNFNLCFQDTIDFTQIVTVPNFVLDLVFSDEFLNDERILIASEGLGQSLGNRTSSPVCSFVSCDPDCSTRGCWGEARTQCQRCQFGELNQDGNCVLQCDPGHFEENEICLNCDRTCAECTGPDPDQCTACTAPLRLFQDSTCDDADCPPGQFLSGQVCVNCDPNCATCDVVATNCTTCVVDLTQPQLLKDTACVPLTGCGVELFPNFITGTCDICREFNPNCRSCEIDFPKTDVLCLECDAPLVLEQSNCIATCPAERFSDNRTCTDCEQCVDKVSFASVDCDPNTNRVCTPCAVCNATVEFVEEECNIRDDTVCTTFSVCNTTFQREERAPTATSDRLCVSKEPCAVEPCQNNGTCVTLFLGADFRCDCIAGFSGQFCEIDESPCDAAVDPCQNEAECVATNANSDGFFCVCNNTANRTETCGRTCQVVGAELCSSACNSDPCLNEGVCTPVGASDFACSCGAENTFCGKQCQLSGDVCLVASSAASNTGTIGAVAGGLVFVILAVIIAAFLYQRRLRKNLIIPENMPILPREKPDEWEIEPRALLTIGKLIGEGHFGSVHKGLYQDPMQPEGANARDVAIKLLKAEGAGTQEEADFWAEMKLMKEIGRHPNVISLVGVCTLDAPLLLVLEYADHGDLKGYLRDRRASETHPALLTAKDLDGFCVQIAHGMEYLSGLKVIHRDLATRNVLVCSGKILKISDFGLARDVYEEDFYQKTSKGKMPFKWMAPEALMDRVFTTASDVWSFGIVMWEVYTLGNAPYPTITNAAVLEALKTGYRMPRPEDFCSQEMYDVMLATWEFYPSARPTFTDLKATMLRITGIDPDSLGSAAPGRGGGQKQSGYDEMAYENPMIDGSTYGAGVDGAYEEPDNVDGAYQEPDDNFYDIPNGSQRKGSRRTAEAIGSFHAVTLHGNGNGNGALARHPTVWDAEDGEAVYDMGDEDVEEEDEAVYDMGDAIYDMGDAPMAAAPTEQTKLLRADPGQVKAANRLSLSTRSKKSYISVTPAEELEDDDAIYDMGDEEEDDAIYDLGSAPVVTSGVNPLYNATQQQLNAFADADEDERPVYDNM